MRKYQELRQKRNLESYWFGFYWLLQGSCLWLAWRPYLLDRYRYQVLVLLVPWRARLLDHLDLHWLLLVLLLQHSHMLAFAPENEMDTFLGPIHPEEFDIEQAKQRAKKIISNTSNNESLLLKARQVLAYSPLMTNEDYNQKVANAWIDYRKDDGWLLARINANKARTAKFKSTLSTFNKFLKR